MEVFEVHITGDESILEVGKRLGVKTIAIDLLRKDRSVLRSEFMTSEIMKCPDYETCKKQVRELVAKLEEARVPIVRVKIESPYYEHYVDQSLYMESHFETIDDFSPISRNRNKTKFLSTEREYIHERYDEFREVYADKELELCLYDSDVYEDKDWFDLYDMEGE